MIHVIDPPLVNTASLWASTAEELRALYCSPATGAVTVRTSLLNGFDESPQRHQYCFLDVETMRPLPATHPSTESQPAPATNSPTPARIISSLNTLGYSPTPLATYLHIAAQIQQDTSNDTANRVKPFIFSVAGTSASEIAACYQQIAENKPTSARYMCEINLSCPNIDGKPPPAHSADQLGRVLAAVAPLVQRDVPLGLKLPPYTHAEQFEMVIEALLQAPATSSMPVSASPVSFLTMTNTLGSSLMLSTPRAAIADDASASVADRYESVLAPAHGGLGGMAGVSLHPLALGNVASFRRLLNQVSGHDAAQTGQAQAQRCLQNISIIGAGGVVDHAGFQRMQAAGADVVGVATALGYAGVGIFEEIQRPPVG